MNKGLALLIALPLLYQSASAADRIEDMKRQTVLVTSEGFLAGGRGSGVLMDSTHVLTCAHMASAADDEFFIYTYPFGTVVKAHVESINFPADLAVLKLDSAVKVYKKPTYQAKIADGDQITVVGNAIGAMKWYVTRGIISGRERDYLMTDAQVHPGNSGGPWFNQKGEIVGISDWGLKKYPDIAGGVSAKTILATLKGWEDQKKGMAMILKLLGGN